MNPALLLVLVLVSVVGTFWLQNFMGGFLAFVPLMALGILAIFWAFGRSNR